MEFWCSAPPLRWERRLEPSMFEFSAGELDRWWWLVSLLVCNDNDYQTCNDILLPCSSFSMERQLSLNDWVCDGVAHQFLLTTASFWKTQYVSPLVTFLWWYKDIQFTKIQTAKVAIFSHWSRTLFSIHFYSTHATVLWISHKDCPLFGLATQNLPHRSFHKDHII